MAKSLIDPWRPGLRNAVRAVPRFSRWIDRLLAPQGPLPAQRVRMPAPDAATPGTARMPLPGRWSSHRLGLSLAPGELAPHMDYWLYEPSRRHAGPLPLVVMLHGCRQTPEAFAAGTRMNALAEREGFFVAYAEQPMRRQLQRCWQWFDAAKGDGAREALAVAALIDTLRARRDVCPQRVYLAGLSAGAAMAALVALRFPDRVAAVGLHSGVPVGAADSARAGLRAMRHGSPLSPEALLAAAGVDSVAGGLPMPALIVHGTEDDVVNPINARLLARQFLAYNGLPDRWPAQPRGAMGASATLAAGHYVEASFRDASRDVVQLCEVAGLGHAWSGGDPAYRYHSGTGPQASALMWDFFRQHSR